MQKPTEIQTRVAINEKAIGLYLINIIDFLRVTTTAEMFEMLLKEKHESSAEYLPCLEFDVKTGKITGHEGRHRAANYYNDGHREMLIALYPEPKHRKWKHDLSQMPNKLTGQFNNFQIELNKNKIERILQNIEGYDPNTGEREVIRASVSRLPDRARAIIIDNVGRLLLGVGNDGTYRLPGGKLKEGEHPVDALLREVYEETGLLNFQDIEYLWPHLGNYIFIFIPEGVVNLTCVNDPSKEFKSLEWVNIESLPSNMDSYSEDIIYRFLRVGVLQNGKEKPMKNFAMSGHIDVLVDGKKEFQLDDDTIWETLPRLAQERSKGRDIEFRQINDDSIALDQTPETEKEEKEEKGKEKQLKKRVKSFFVSAADTFYFDNYIRIDPTSELLNPGVQVLKCADTFDNTLLFDGNDEFWITKYNRPVWRSSFDSRYASYDEIVQIWNKRYPEHSIGVDWLKGLLRKLIELPKELNVEPEAKTEKKEKKESNVKDKTDKTDKTENKDKKDKSDKDKKQVKKKS